MPPSPVSLLDCTFLKRSIWNRKCCKIWIPPIINNGCISISGMVVGSMIKGSLWVTCLSALGMAVKGWNDFKKFSIKVYMSHFAFTTYAKTLTELRNYVQGLPFDEDAFLVKMQRLDDTITDFAPPLSDAYVHAYGSHFKFVVAKGSCFADCHPRAPTLNTTCLPLLEKRDYKNNHK